MKFENYGLTNVFYSIRLLRMKKSAFQEIIFKTEKCCINELPCLIASAAFEVKTRVNMQYAI